MLQIENAQKFGKENVDAALKSFGAVLKGAQALAVEVADYAKKSFEDGAAVFEKLLGARTVENAIRIQSDYVTAAYEGFVAQSKKVGDIVAAAAKDAFKPYENTWRQAGEVSLPDTTIPRRPAFGRAFSFVGSAA